MNQEAKRDIGKTEVMLVPPQIIMDIARVRMFGNRKYHDPDNWKTVEVERYWNAAARHFVACMRNPKSIDEESGLPHRWHLECNLAFIAELEERNDQNRERQCGDARNSAGADSGVSDGNQGNPKECRPKVP